MGCRAVLTFDKQCKPNSIGVYLHWSGDTESVAKILDKVRDYARTPDSDPPYALARLIEACCEASSPYSETGCGVGLLKDLDTDNGDNGTYIIGDDWKVVARKHAR